MNCSSPYFPILCHLLELVQTHVHWVGDVIKTSCPLSSLSLIALNHSHYQGHFLTGCLFASGGQCIGASLSASVFPMNLHGLSPLGLTGWISLQSKGLSRVISNPTAEKHQFFSVQPSLWSISHPSITIWKTKALTICNFVCKVRSLIFNMMSRLVIVFLPRRKRLLIYWLQSPSAMILEPKEIKSATVFIFSLSICHEVMGLDATKDEF